MSLPKQVVNIATIAVRMVMLRYYFFRLLRLIIESGKHGFLSGHYSTLEMHYQANKHGSKDMLKYSLYELYFMHITEN